MNHDRQTNLNINVFFLLYVDMNPPGGFGGFSFGTTPSFGSPAASSG